MTDYTWTFQGLQSGDLNISTINATEQDAGLAASFYGANNPTAITNGSLTGMQWTGYQFGVVGPNSSLDVTLSYLVTDTNPGEAIDSIEQYYNVFASDPTNAVTATAVEDVYTAPGGQLIGSTTWSLASGTSSSSVNLSGDFQQVYVTLTLDESIGANGVAPGPSGPGTTLQMSILGQYFGESALSAITGSVFCDTNGSGTFQTGETYMSGVTVDLLNSGGTVVATTVTDSSGNYNFGGLAAGTYTTEVIAPAGDTITANGTTTINLSQGQTVNAGQTGLDMPAVWNVNVEFDEGNGTLVGLPFVTVSLEDASGHIVNYGTTDTSGDISFGGLQVGSNYQVVVTTPAGDTVEQSINVGTVNEALSCGTISSSETVGISNVVGLTPGVAIVKTVTSVGGQPGDGTATYVGEPIDYQIVVSNVGNETLTDVLVTDPTLGQTLATLASLAVGATVTYTTSTTVTQAELDSGQAIPNTAVVTDDQTPSQTSTVTTPVAVSPAVSIVKTVTSVGNQLGDPAATYAGEVIDYQVVVTNTGDETLTNVLVTDPTLGTTLGSLASLAVGASMTYTASTTVTQAELDSRNAIPNTAVVTDDQTPSQTSTVTTPVAVSPAVSIVKTVTSVGNQPGDPAATYAGEVIDYQVVVTNTGDETLTNVVVTDPTLGTTLGSLASLAVGASMTYTASTTVTQAELDSRNAIPNTAVVTDTQTPPQTSTVTTPVSVSPAVSIVKTVTSVGNQLGDPAATYAGEVIKYQVVVSNTGDETLTNVLVTDPTLGTTLGSLASLAVGASMTYTASTTVTQAELDSRNAIPNTAVVTDTQTPSQTSTVTTPVAVSPAVSIVKTVTSVGNQPGDPAATYAGEVIDYQVVVTNTGDETLTNVVVTDPTLGTTLGSLASLAVGGNVTYTAAQTVTQAELDSRNAIPNSAVVTDTQTPPQTSTVTTPVSVSPAVSIVKTVTSVGGVAGAPAATYAGEVIDYKVVVSNTGNETLTNVLVTDPTLGLTLGSLASLAVGGNVTYTAAQTVTQAELASGNPVPNTAVVTDTQTPSQTSTVTTPVSQSPGVSIVKSVTSVGGVAGDPAATYAGEVIDYKIVVSNTGSETLTNVVVKDTTLGTTLGTLASLAVGASVTYTASQTVTQADINQVLGTTTGCGGSVTHTGPSSGCGSGSTAWFCSTFNPTSCADGATYTFTGITCTISGSGTGGSPITEQCPNATVTFSKSCTQASTTFDSSNNCWVTTLPANCNPGSVFLCGVPVTVPSGCNFNNCNFTWSIGQSSNNCGASSLSWDASCTGFNNFNQSGCNGFSNYNQIGVQSCDNLNNSCNYWSWGGWNWGSSTTCAGTPQNQYNWGNCGSTSFCQGGNSCGGSGTCNCTTPPTNCSGNTVINTATVTDTQGVTGTSTVSTVISGSPGVSIVKSVTSVGGVCGDPAANYAGEVIDYQIVVANTGNEALTNVVVTDATLGTTLGTIASMAKGAVVTYTAAQTVTQAEIDSGNNVTNTATVTDTQGVTGSSTASTCVSQCPGVSIVKTVKSVGGVNGDPTATYAGEVINYQVVVSNTGNETLTNVLVADPTLGTTLGSLASLAVGASATYTASATVTSAELKAGSPITNTATVTDTQHVTGTSTVSTNVGPSNGISVIKVPSQVVVGTCGQVTYTFQVTNTGNSTLTNVKLVDNIGTASNPDYISPVLQTTGTNGSLAAGQTWTYTATVNQSGDYSSKGGSQSCSIGGQDLGSGCTAWLNSSFTPTSCADGATYNFKGITCTIKGPYCGSFSVNVPDACVTFSKGCTQPTTTYNASENCWVTTLPAGSNPGNVFLSGLPYGIPSGTNLSGATCTWNIGQSANNCGSSNLNWQTGCTGYNNFSINNCNGQADYNQIGVKVCDNSSGYGNGGNTNQGYGWNYNDNSGYCGGSNYWGGWWGSGSNWNGSSNDCAGTPENQYCGSNGGSNNYWGGYGWGGYGGGNNNGGTCNNGGSSGSVSCGQLGDSSQADTATVTATGAGNATVTATSTTEVQVLASNSPITLNGTNPTGNLPTLYGTPEKLEFSYTPGNSVSLANGSKALATVVGSNSSSPAFLEISNSNNPFASNAAIYFEGEVQTGEKIFADATINQLTNTPNAAPNNVFSTSSGSELFAYVFSSQAAFNSQTGPVQTMTYSTASTNGMSLGDTVGSLKLLGYVGSSGGHLVS